MICPYCKSGSGFEQITPLLFKCRDCGFELKICEDFQTVWITIKNKIIILERKRECLLKEEV